jgi:hypothetical protein
MFGSRLSRRQFLRLSGAAAALVMLDVTRLRSRALTAPALRSEWTFGDVLPTEGVFETPPLQPETRFDSVDVSWLADRPDDRVHAELRTRSSGGEWSDWNELHADGHQSDAADPRRFVAPVLARGEAVQVRLTIEPGAGLRALTVGTLDASRAAGPQALQAEPPAPIDGFIIPRAGWSADESWRHIDQDPAKPIAWPPRYQDVEKIIVHHTVTTNNPPDPAAALRSIYYYHAITRGWGDIGYNFLVDWSGKVYEGRFGGPRVIAGHALKYNPGSLGIALLGDFSYASPPRVMLDSLVRLVKTRAPHVDVTTAADFVDLIGLANLCGHRDVLVTGCPGDATYELLPALRGTIAGTGPIDIPPPLKREWIDLVDCTIGPSTAHPGNLLEVRVTVTNPSVATIVSGGPDPGFVYEEGQDYNAVGFPKVSDEYRFALDLGLPSTTPNPYRWGFGPPIAPGETREVVGYVRLKSLGRRACAVSTVKELVDYLVEDQFPTTITSAPPPVAPVAPSRNPTTQFFSETGHNVPEPFISYWHEHGGLRRFGFPLTEPFEEVSETDGGSYLTQYFERARFEHHPAFAGTVDEVMLGLLGTETNTRRAAERAFQRIAAFPSTPDRIYFPETGHSLSGIFLRIWQERGGLRIFGYPISEELQEHSETDGVTRTVQYFERNRFEHHPDFAGAYDEVMFGHLGREVLIRRGWLQGVTG